MAVSVGKFYLQFHLQTAKLLGEIMQDLSQGGTLKLRNYSAKSYKMCYKKAEILSYFVYCGGNCFREISEVRIAFRFANIVT